MLALIDQYQKQLEKVNLFAASTIETYTISVKAFCQYAKTSLHIDPARATADQLLQWLLNLKHSGIGYSRFENHHYALKSFFAFIQKAGMADSNPAQALPLLINRRRQRTNPITASEAFKLLACFERNTWTGLRDFTMVSMLWALGLRTSELTGLAVRDFEPAHGKRTGLLTVPDCSESAAKTKNNVRFLSSTGSLTNSSSILRTLSRLRKNQHPCFLPITKKQSCQTADCSALLRIRPKRPPSLPG